MKTKRLWIARGESKNGSWIYLNPDEMQLNKYSSEWSSIGEFVRVAVCYAPFSRLTGLKLKRGQQIECKITQLKKGFKVEKV